MSRFLGLLALLLPLTFLLACGGGGGGGGPTEPPPPPPPPPAGIVVTPAAAPSTGVSIARGAATTQSTLILEIRANSVNDLYGVAFDLRYPSNILQLVQASAAGSILGTPNLQSVPGSGSGVVIVGLSKLGAVSGASGSGVLMTLEFRAIAAGQGSFSFEQTSAVSPSGQPISGFGWSAGTVQVTL